MIFGIMIRVLAFLLTATSALACSVPVFRYALEHWEADAYRVTVPHGTKVDGKFNVTKADAPKIELRQPAIMRNEEVIWSADFNEANVKTLEDSPARQQIAERLGAGESARALFGGYGHGPFGGVRLLWGPLWGPKAHRPSWTKGPFFHLGGCKKGFVPTGLAPKNNKITKQQSKTTKKP